jgi:hypothetical protein
MQHDASHGDRPITATGHTTGAACVAAVLLAAGTLVAGCGGGAPSAGVASLGSRTSSTGSVAAGSSGSGEASPGSQAVAFAACMRSHGVPNFPAPQISHNGNGVSVKMALPAAIGKNPKFGPAQEACRKLLPNGGAPTNQPTVSPQEQGQYLKAAACIRSHGVPNFPDPTFSGGGVHLDHRGLNLSSPELKAAVHACESLIPGGAHGPSSGHEGSTSEAAP